MYWMYARQINFSQINQLYQITYPDFYLHSCLKKTAVKNTYTARIVIAAVCGIIDILGQ